MLDTPETEGRRVAVKGNIFGISRKLLSHEMWLGETFTKGQAWVDLVGLARWRPGEVTVGKAPYTKTFTLERGQLCWSTVKLSERWKWSRGKTSRYLSWHALEQRIVQQNYTVTTLITILNYDDYQFDDTGVDTALDTRVDTDLGARKNTVNTENTVNIKVNAGEKAKLIMELIRLWSELVPSMKPLLDPMNWNEVRKIHLDTLMSRGNGLDEFKQAMKLFEQSDKLTGRDPNHTAVYGFDWLIDPKNFYKILEGNFENNRKRAQRATATHLDKQMDIKTEEILREVISEFPEHESHLKHFLSGERKLPPEIQTAINERK